MLGPGNEVAAQKALAAWPGGLQVGGGITADNAKLWIANGAEKVRLLLLAFGIEELRLTNLFSRSSLPRTSFRTLGSRWIDWRQ